jgi:hypothetical protein
MNRVKRSLNPTKSFTPSKHRLKSFREPTEKEIAHFAFSIFSQEDPQRALEIWRQAKAQLIADRKHDAGLLQAADFFPSAALK